MIMTLKEFAKILDGREYLHEITKEEEALAKELGFVVVFGYSDDNAELRGAIDDEIGCYDGGVLEHDGLPSIIYADWCPKDIDCSWRMTHLFRTKILKSTKMESYIVLVSYVILTNQRKPMQTESVL